MTQTPREAPDGSERDWRIYRGNGRPHTDIDQLPAPPRWRQFDGGPLVADSAPQDAAEAGERATSYQAGDDVIEMVNAALYLRRPLLVTGKPGTGKSSLAHSVAYELGLGPVLYWPVTSRTTLADGLYRYDAIGRLQDSGADAPDIGRYLSLGPLGTALLPRHRPRVLLVDELDKSDIDLPNDLLNVFEEGRYEIPELTRLPADQAEVDVMTADGVDRVRVTRGRVKCRAFPIVVITSNGEREFPPAFLRRCVQLTIAPPDKDKLLRIVTALLGPEVAADSDELVNAFLEQRYRSEVATDQLLNAIYLVTSGIRPPEATRERLRAALLRPLDQTGTG
ncbi:ATPase AAA [Longispora fulva]|uniref:MoxR-like ATPase n=1 Tax=Longispora fulva TaxID=619741 RepID=A0A8J7GYH9_9ACTN|nr:MoxR family ATPase [Longispora fulva]MBG6141410.1 MoxR-like ATPase [Longispora fulva]GIG59440.1 ATPase AAA [Longispora fulva]